MIKLIKWVLSFYDLNFFPYIKNINFYTIFFLTYCFIKIHFLLHAVWVIVIVKNAPYFKNRNYQFKIFKITWNKNLEEMNCN